MPGGSGSQGPKPNETQPKAPTTPQQKPAQTPAQKAEQTKEKKEETIGAETKKQLKEMMDGMDLVGSIKGVMESWANLWKLILNLGDELDNMKYEQDPVKRQKILSDIEKRIKVPDIKNKDALKTKLEKPNENEKLVDYLYRSIGLPKPDVKEIKPPTTEVKIPHLIMQLKKSLGWAAGRKSITEKFTNKKKRIFNKGDMVVLRDKLAGKGKEFNAGFVVAINETNVYIRNNESEEPKKYPCAQLFVAFQIPGNANNGKAPEYPGADKDKDKKQ